MMNLTGKENDRWKVIGYEGAGRWRYLCKQCGAERIGSTQLYTKGVCALARKRQKAEYKRLMDKGERHPSAITEYNPDALPLNESSLPKKLNSKGVKALCCQLLYESLKDANSKNAEQRRKAGLFIASSWCKEMCEILNIDYKSYVNKFYKNKDKIK